MNNLLLCKHCKKGGVEWVRENEPYTPGHWQCPLCDSTFPETDYPFRTALFTQILTDIATNLEGENVNTLGVAQLQFKLRVIQSRINGIKPYL